MCAIDCVISPNTPDAATLPEYGSEINVGFRCLKTGMLRRKSYTAASIGEINGREK